MDAFELPLAEDILSRAEALARRAGELLNTFIFSATPASPSG